MKLTIVILGKWYFKISHIFSVFLQFLLALSFIYIYCCCFFTVSLLDFLYVIQDVNRSYHVMLYC